MSGRRYPVGTEIQEGGVHFRVWAPRANRVEVGLEGGPGAGTVATLAPEADGWHAALVPGAAAGTRYRFRLDGDGPYPDPASRSQPEGPHGPSEVVDPAYPWTDDGWRGVEARGQVLYELHVGTFTPEGTWAAAARRLPDLARLGVTCLELMPVAEFPGRFGWGYDGVDLFAPTRLYGRPEDFRRFVDEAHRLGLGVLLDVVYNHFGPDGCYLRAFSPDWFSDRYVNEWGDPVNFDGPGSDAVRAHVLANAAYWVEEFHVDGFRVDATQQTWDASPEHVCAALARVARERAPHRRLYVVAENEPQETRYVRPAAEGGYGYDAVWADDVHHSAVVALTGRQEAYYTDYHGAPQEFVSAAKRGHLYQGQWYAWQKQRRGTPTTGLPAHAFVAFLENHDQVANSARGERLHRRTSPGRWRAATALLLLGPWTPLLFQGQEFSSSRPFRYFADHEPDLAAKVREGRAAFLSQFRSLATPEMRERLEDPGAVATWADCKLDWAERERHVEAVRLHADLLRLRREDPAFRAHGEAGFDGAVLGPEAFALRWFHPEGDRLLLVNFGRDLRLHVAPEPLLAPPRGRTWATLWSSEHPDYGGAGTPPLDTEENWRIPGHAAVVLCPAPNEEDESDA